MRGLSTKGRSDLRALREDLESLVDAGGSCKRVDLSAERKRGLLGSISKRDVKRD
jgi:hypothetical protein